MDAVMLFLIVARSRLGYETARRMAGKLESGAGRSQAGGAPPGWAGKGRVGPEETDASEKSRGRRFLS
jgi:hypothetical protein